MSYSIKESCRMISKRNEVIRNQRESLVYLMAEKYREDAEYINRLLTFFSGDPFGLPTDEQRARVEKHLQNKANELYHQRASKDWCRNLILITGRSNDHG